MGVGDVGPGARPLAVDASHMAFHFLLQVAEVRAVSNVGYAALAFFPRLKEGRLDASRRPRARAQPRHEGFCKTHPAPTSRPAFFIIFGEASGGQAWGGRPFPLWDTLHEAETSRSCFLRPVMQIICETEVVSVEDRQGFLTAAWAGRAQGIGWSADLPRISPASTLEPCFPTPVI